MKQNVFSRRRHVRLRAGGRGHFAVCDQKDPSKSLHAGRFALEDLSADGARVEIADVSDEHVGKLLAGGEILTMLFDEIIGSAVRVKAAVRWVRRQETGYFMGVEFVDVEKELAEKLRAFLYNALDSGDRTTGNTPALWALRKRRLTAYVAIGAAAALLGLALGRLSVPGTSPGKEQSLSKQLIAKAESPAVQELAFRKMLLKTK